MKTVNILLSTYNGEPYVGDLLDSLLAQTYPEIQIHIRDDGSTDGTWDVLEKYLKKSSNIHLYKGENVGYRESFFWLLSNCKDADYYAYCDQDDIWLPEKVQRSVAAVEHFEDIPCLYVGNFYWCDGACRPLYRHDGYKKYHSLEKYITCGDMNTFGFSEVFNEKTASGLREHKCTKLIVHDQVAYLYALCFGKVVWGRRPLAYYRRTGGNASPQELVGGNQFTHFFWRVKTFLFQFDWNRIYGRFYEFYRAYQSELPEKEKTAFILYLNRGNRWKKACFSGRYRDKLSEELAVRFLFLIGRM